MHMQARVIEEGILRLHVPQYAAGHRLRDARALPHHVSQLAGCHEGRRAAPAPRAALSGVAAPRGIVAPAIALVALPRAAPLSGHAILHSLNVEHGAPHAGPREAHDHSRRRVVTVDAVRVPLGLAHVVLEVAVVDAQGRGLTGDHLEGHLAANLLRVLLEVAHAGLTAVPADELESSAVGEFHLVLGDAHLLPRVGVEVFLHDGHLLVRHVAREAHHLHAVEQGPRNGVQHVGRAQEEDARQVHGCVEVVVYKGAVLRGVEDLEERGGRVPREAAPELVNLVDHDHRVGCGGGLEALDELARHGAHVGAAVALNLRHIVQAAHGEAVKLAVEGLGDGLADGGLAHARRPHKAQDLALRGPAQRPDSDELLDALLDVLHAVMLLVEHLLGAREVKVLLLVDAPGQNSEPVEVVTRGVELSARVLEALELELLLVNHFARLLRDRLVREALLKLGEEHLLVVLLHAQLFLDLLELLAQDVVALVVGELLLRLLGDLGLHAAELELLLEQLERLAQARFHIQLLEHLLKRLTVHRGHGRAHVRQGRGVVHVHAVQEHLHLLLEERVELDNVLDCGNNLQGVRLAHIVRLLEGTPRAPAAEGGGPAQLGASGALVVGDVLLVVGHRGRPPVLEELDLDPKRGVVLDDALNLHAPLAVEQGMHPLTRAQGHDACDGRKAADVVDTLRVLEQLAVLHCSPFAARALPTCQEDADKRICVRGLEHRLHECGVRDVHRVCNAGEEGPRYGGDSKEAQSGVDLLGLCVLHHGRAIAGRVCCNGFGHLLVGVVIVSRSLARKKACLVEGQATGWAQSRQGTPGREAQPAAERR
mmetsp:Transcript_11480/g.34080  ORF Transcript_11480/g.34080 Transcript_11480/m.34080 type:complete len:824 (+) Transcript_11480:877-3348(+)